MRPNHQHRGEELGKGACFKQSLTALWLQEMFPAGSLVALVSGGALHFAAPALWWESHSSYPPWEYPVVIHVPVSDLKRNPQNCLTVGSIGRVLWNVPPVDAAWLKFKWYKCKFWKCIISYDKVWQRNVWFSLIVSYILFLWELRRMFSYLTCFLSSLQFICQSDPPKESKLALIVRQMRRRAGKFTAQPFLCAGCDAEGESQRPSVYLPSTVTDVR